MPELPDITLYLEALSARIQGQQLLSIEIKNPFFLRSAEPPFALAHDRTVVSLHRVGKRIVIGLDGDLWLVLHLMIAGRLSWFDSGQAVRGRQILAQFNFASGALAVTEAGSKRRASLYVVGSTAALAAHDPGGLEVLGSDLLTFRERLQSRNHTLKRALTDPHLFSGIGNAYSDEILHAAALSPIAQTQKLTAAEIDRLQQACIAVLTTWTTRLRLDVDGNFPQKVTAFRPGMAVHGRYGQPCPVCATAVQRIRYADNEVNYCPRCQTGGRLLADRALSRLLRRDWPRSIEELERIQSSRA